MFQESAPIISNKEVMPGVFQMWLESPEIATGALPGQFVMATCDSGPGHLLRRPISVHQVNGKRLALLFAVTGSGTGWLAQKAAGEKIDLLGPLGQGFKIKAGSRKLLMVAGGLGIAPLFFLAQEAQKKGCAVRLLTGARTASLICPADLIPSGTECLNITEDGSAGEKGLVTSLLARHSDWADQIFACGPIPMYRAMVNLQPAFSPELPVQISLEVRMGCGLGFCYACTIHTRQGLKQVCKDGPVFNLDDILWDKF